MEEFRVSEIVSGSGFGRRDFLKGSLALGVLAGVGGGLWFDAGWAFADGPTVGLGSGTVPEQVHLQWGRQPPEEITVSWASPGSTPQPAPTIAFSTAPITTASPGQAGRVDTVEFQDGLNLETVYWYHAPLRGLLPDPTYFYAVSDGASPANTVTGTFKTAPAPGRTPFRFSSFGDLATPTSDRDGSGHTWSESSDNSYYAVSEVENNAPLFHLLNGDLCYANLNTNNQPEVWRDFFINVSRSAANRPWMLTLG
jgi:phosphodiesterase/alkaline phosphatase D-like protein